MDIRNGNHLSYCTNIHPGESWEKTFENLNLYTLAIKRNFDNNPFGIGLRLSNQAANTLLDSNRLSEFKSWLDAQNIYVFTLNGFPYGNFHHQVVKDQVHSPDWTTQERLIYTKNLFNILSQLLPEGIEGGISTSPLSYRFWYNTPEKLEKAKTTALNHLMEVVIQLIEKKEKQGQTLHLDIEPEPDGILENSEEFITYFNKFLLNEGRRILQSKIGFSAIQAEQAIRDHIAICYDVCHFAVEFENQRAVILKLLSEGIKIGKIQISAALKATWQNDQTRNKIARQLTTFDESNYLHQALVKNEKKGIKKFRDLGPALEAIQKQPFSEIRTHFHVPVFTDSYGDLQSTQDEIVNVLSLWCEAPFCKHLEVETYTWEVLPSDLKFDLVDFISRELSWVYEFINNN